MYRFCDVDFIRFWDYTPVETGRMLKISHEKLKYEVTSRAILLQCISNAPHFGRKDQKPRELEEFLPDFAQDENKHVQTEEETQAALIAWAKSFQ